jgi:amino acid transporter
MQPELILVFITVWLFILWFGSIALEATGLERKRARFQALSALTGTGFTTREAEDIVGHPRRRLIASWMMFLGSVGIILFLLLFLVIIIIGLKPVKPTSVSLLVVSAIPPAIFIILFWLGVADKLATLIVNGLKRSSYFTPEVSIRETVHQSNDYSIARLTMGRKAPEVGRKVGDAALAKHNITLLAIERGDRTLPFPQAEEVVEAGDHLLFFGKTDELRSLIKQ